MKTGSRFAAAILLGTAMVAFSGCYTQVGGVLDDRYASDQYVEEEVEQEGEYDSTYTDDREDYGADWEYWRPHTYFDYYYPSFTFGFGYYSPWYMNRWSSWRYGYYDPFYSDPWGWGVYGGGYAPGWWYPHNSGYVSGRTRQNVTRTFGNTRAFGSSRGTVRGTVSTTGSGYMRPGDGTLIQGRTSGRPSGTTGRSGVTTGRQGSQSRSSEGRSSAPVRRVAPGSRKSGESRQAPAYTPPPRRDGNSGGREPSGGGRESSGGGRSYSPPPSSGSSGSSGSAPDRSGGRSSGGESGGSRSSGNRR